MYLLYSFLLLTGVLLFLPYLLFLALGKRKYRASFWQRCGFLPSTLDNHRGPVLWLHAVSVGETLAAVPLVQALEQRLPGYRVLISTTTLTGQAVARQRFGLDRVFFFPFDFAFSVRRVLRRLQPAAVVLMESELWPRFLRECNRRHIPVISANGRLSDRSFRRYSRMPRIAGWFLPAVSLWLMQSTSDRDRLARLGVPEDRIRVCGNLKYDLGPGDEVKSQEIGHELAHHFNLTGDTLLIVAGSTTDGEEPIILESYRLLQEQLGDRTIRLLIAPRHPERFDEVARLAQEAGHSLTRRSASGNGANAPAPTLPSSGGRATDVLLLDSIGELAAVYRFASLVFVGGSLVPKGGHNILEPARYAKPIVVGPYMENFRQIMTDFSRSNAVVQVTASSPTELSGRLARTWLELLADDERRRQLGEAARQVLIEHQGAANRMADEIVRLLRHQPQ